MADSANEPPTSTHREWCGAEFEPGASPPAPRSNRSSGPVPEEAYERAAEHFPGPLLAQLVVVITAINAWNRVMLAGDVRPAPLED